MSGIFFSYYLLFRHFNSIFNFYSHYKLVDWSSFAAAAMYFIYIVYIFFFLLFYTFCKLDFCIFDLKHIELDFIFIWNLKINQKHRWDLKPLPSRPIPMSNPLCEISMCYQPETDILFFLAPLYMYRSLLSQWSLGCVNSPPLLVIALKTGARSACGVPWPWLCLRQEPEKHSGLLTPVHLGFLVAQLWYIKKN